MSEKDLLKELEESAIEEDLDEDQLLSELESVAVDEDGAAAEEQWKVEQKPLPDAKERFMLKTFLGNDPHKQAAKLKEGGYETFVTEDNQVAWRKGDQTGVIDPKVSEISDIGGMTKEVIQDVFDVTAEVAESIYVGGASALGAAGGAIAGAVGGPVGSAAGATTGAVAMGNIAARQFEGARQGLGELLGYRGAGEYEPEKVEEAGFWGGVGGILPGVSKSKHALKSATQKSGGSALADLAGRFSTKQSGKALQMSKADIKKLGFSTFDEVADIARDEKLLTILKPTRKSWEQVSSKLSQLGNDIGEQYKKLDTLAPKGVSEGDIMKALIKRVEPRQGSDKLVKVLKSGMKEVMKQYGEKAPKPILTAGGSPWKEGLAKGKVYKPTDLWRVAKELNKRASTYAKEQKDFNRAGLMSDAAAYIREVLINQADAAGLSGLSTQAKKYYLLKNVERALEDQTAATLAKSQIFSSYPMMRSWDEFWKQARRAGAHAGKKVESLGKRIESAAPPKAPDLLRRGVGGSIGTRISGLRDE
jgi:hypothetical protein